MTDSEIKIKVEHSISKAPEHVWDRIKEEVARGIAKVLLEKLETRKAPCKQECMDRVNAMVASNMPKRYLKGA